MTVSRWIACLLHQAERACTPLQMWLSYAGGWTAAKPHGAGYVRR